MREPRVVKSRSGDFELRHLPPLLAQSLRELPSLLADDAPGVGERLFPDPYGGQGRESEEWARLAVPELRHLFESARALVAADLEGFRREGFARSAWRLPIPASHLPAWLSALAAARVALGTAHGLEPEDMDRPLPAAIEREKDRAVLLVHLLGWAQGLLVEAGA